MPRLLLVLVAAAGLLAWPSATSPPQQSPIDLRTGTAATASTVELVASTLRYRPSPLRLEYVHRDDCAHRGKEETIAGTVSQGAAGLAVGGVAYQLVGVHWHTPGEHRLHGRHFPLEQHLVHRGPGGRLLVVAVFVTPGASNATLERIFAALPAECGPPRHLPEVTLADLLPTGTRAYRYTGSLTTAPYPSGVLWVVLTEPITATAAQLDRFHAIFPAGNARELPPR